MDRSSNKTMDRFVEVASKIGNQIHLRSLRDAFAIIMPLFILAGLGVLVNSVVFPWIFSGEALSNAQQFGTAINNGTLNIAGLLLCPTIAFYLSGNRSFGSPFSASIIALSSLIVVMPLEIVVSDESVEIISGGLLTLENLGTNSMFAGIIVGLLATELLVLLSKSDRLKINLGEQVPPAVANSFTVMIPSMITVSIFALLSLFLNVAFEIDLISLIVLIIQEPLRSIGSSLIGYTFLYSLGNFFFTFGIHQNVINGSFTSPFLLQNMNENMLAFSEGEEIPYILTSSFQTAFPQMGGTGATISLIIAIFLFSKFKPYRQVSALGLGPGIFEINEPIIFGLPIVFNLPMMIPFVLLPAIQTLIAYYATALGLVSRTVVNIPWVTPPIISGYLATAGDWRAPLLQVLLLALGVIFYWPFLRISERVSMKQAELEVN